MASADLPSILQNICHQTRIFERMILDLHDYDEILIPPNNILKIKFYKRLYTTN